MTTRTTTFGQGSHPVRAVDLKTSVRRGSSTESALWRSSGLRTEDFSTIAPPYYRRFVHLQVPDYQWHIYEKSKNRSLTTLAAIAVPEISQETLAEMVGTTRWCSTRQVRVAFMSATSICFGLLILVTVDKEMAAVLAILTSRSQLRT
jgi:hypothetical protein